MNPYSEKVNEIVLSIHNLREVGLYLAKVALEKDGFSRIKSIEFNDRRMDPVGSISYGDIIAYKGDKKKVIQIVTRHKHYKNGKINSRYIYIKKKKLPEIQGTSSKACSHYNVQYEDICWIAVQISVNVSLPEITYSIFFGSISDLTDESGKIMSAIPMKEADFQNYRQLINNGKFVTDIKMETIVNSIPKHISDNYNNFIEICKGKNAFLMIEFKEDLYRLAIEVMIKDLFKQYEIIILKADEHRFDDNKFINIETYLWGCDFGIALFDSEVNSNIYLEIGYMLALNKKVIIIKEKNLTLLGDLDGKLFIEFDKSSLSINEENKLVGNGAKKIVEELKKWLNIMKIKKKENE
jgi:hypothetical protein